MDRPPSSAVSEAKHAREIAWADLLRLRKTLALAAAEVERAKANLEEAEAVLRLARSIQKLLETKRTPR